MQKQPENSQSPEQHGLVISYFGNSVAVEVENGQVVQCHLHRNQELPVVGDQVIWQLENSNTGTIDRILPRRSILARGDEKGNLKKPIAANIDDLVIVMSPAPVFSEYLVDRYLIAAELLQLKPVIVLNKTDLLDDVARQQAYEQLESYRRIGYTVIFCSVHTEKGLDEIDAALKNKAAVLVGPSGVGKSSIIAALKKDDDIRIGEVSPKGAGKHTTTVTRLYHLPQGGHLIDSPGVREFTLWPINKQEVLKGFREFADYAGNCKFRDCQHLAEPGCAVLAAVADGRMNQCRYASYQVLMQQAAAREQNKYK